MLLPENSCRLSSADISQPLYVAPQNRDRSDARRLSDDGPATDIAGNSARTFVEALSRAARLGAKREALHFLGRRTTFEELDALSRKVAGGLQALGLSPGDRIV
jgi:non-ribosomal peptide synthetase component F